jgi:hypothetical protein
MIENVILENPDPSDSRVLMPRSRRPLSKIMSLESAHELGMCPNVSVRRSQTQRIFWLLSHFRQGASNDGFRQNSSWKTMILGDMVRELTS